jgi:large repetitive protein
MEHRYSCAFLLVSVLTWMQVEACGGSGSPNTMQLTITSFSLPDGTVDKPYSATLTATGGTPPYSCGETNGPAMPPGLIFEASGNIAGTPTAAGTFGPYRFSVTDYNSSFESTQNMSISITPASTASSLASCTPRGNEPALTRATPYAFLVKGTDGNGNPIDIAGSFTLDGNGGIAIAAVDDNGFTNGPERLQVDLAASSYALSSSTERQFLT